MQSMRKIALAALVCLALAGCAALSGDKPLPQPNKTGGKPVFEAIDDRGSAVGNNFPMGDISDAELATILWAATGQNRNGQKWTVPMANGKPPYCNIYVAGADGVYLYDWKSNTLKQETNEDIRGRIAMQDFAKKAPKVLILVTDGGELGVFKDNQKEWEYGMTLLGAMAQNVYLASDSLGIGTRYIVSVKHEEVARSVNLGPKDRARSIMPMGKR